VKVFVNGRRSGRRGDDEGRVLEVGDEVALEPAQKALLLVAAERSALAALFPVPECDPRVARAGLREAVEVGRPGDEGVRRQREQQQTCRRARPHKLSRLIVQLFPQTL
jgi:hypothetical protein